MIKQPKVEIFQKNLIDENSDAYSKFFYISINISIKFVTFLLCLKFEDIIYLCKIVKMELNKNFTQLSFIQFFQIFSNKIPFIKCLAFYDDVISKYQYGFRKGCSTHKHL